MPAMVRAQAVRGYRALVAELGGDPARLLRAAKVDGAAFDQPGSFVNFGAVVDLLERAARQLACPDFGLLLAERQDIGILGPLALAMRHSATVGEAMRTASKYVYVYNAAIGFSVRADKGEAHALFSFEILSDRSDYQHRVHVDVVGFEVKGPDRKGRYTVRIGMLDGNELNLGTTRTSVDLDEAEFQRFTALVAATRAARDAGPDPW